MRRFAFITAALLLAGGAVWYLYPQSQPPAQTPSPKNLSFLVAFGVGDKTAAAWNGTIDVTGGSISSLKGWRFAGKDAIQGTTGWTLTTKAAAVVSGTGNVLENGVILTSPDNGGNPAFTVSLTASKQTFSFTAQEIQFGPPKSFLAGRAIVLRVPPGLPLGQTIEEEDFPAIAQSGDDIYMAYVQFVHGDRSKAVAISTKTP